MEAIDRKFIITAQCREHGHIHNESDSILFLAKDRALVPTLLFYRLQCQREGAEEPQLKAVDLMIERVKRFQEKQGTKVADVDMTIPAGAAIVAPNKEEQ